ncbi:MAG: hypothetical protein WBM95_11545, partial [Robiginitalea sp.]
MYKFKISTAFSVLGLLLSCGESDLSRNFSLEMEKGAKKIQQHQSIGVQLKNRAELPVDSVFYFLDGNPVTLTAGKLTFSGPVLGTKHLQAHVFSEGQKAILDTEILVLAKERPALYT